jgi:tetratricopeptide (TPR) repeat protein
MAIAVVGLRARADTRTGVTSMSEPVMNSLLLTYFDDFLSSRDADAFRRRVLGRYNEGTLCRMAQSGNLQTRRAAIFALGLVGSYETNPVVASALRDHDPVVRNLAQNALWAIWFRADTPENNAALEEVRTLIGRDRLDEAIRQASTLIERSPHFSEAYNQRAIAYYHQGNLEQSAADCRRVLRRNPYHIGALSGLGKCYVDLGRRDEALQVFRRLLDLQPFDIELRDTIEVLEAKR